jgi:hypothetical protein
MPDDFYARVMGDYSRREHRRVVEMHERKPLLTQQRPEPSRVLGEGEQLPAGDQPPEAAVGRVPSVREDRDLAGVDRGS